MSIPTHFQTPSSRVWHAVLVFVLAFATMAADTGTLGLDRGLASIEAGRSSDAIKVLSMLCSELGATPEDQGRCWFYLGVAWQRFAADVKGSQAEYRHRRAVAAYEALFALAGKAKLSFSLAPAHNNLARLHAEVGDYERAEVSYEKAVELADEAKRAAYLENYADFLAAGGDLQGAADKYQSVVLLAPESESGYFKVVSYYRNYNQKGIHEFLQRLLQAGQVLRVRDAALSVLEEDEAPLGLREDLLVLAALALSREVYNPRSFPRSETAARWRALANDPEIGHGVRAILLLHAQGEGQPGIYAWWASAGAGDQEPRVTGRREAFRELARAIGRWYKVRGDSEEAERSYRRAGDLVPGESDPKAMEALADLYLESGDNERLRELFAKYEPRLEHDVNAATVSDEAVLDYRETASRILLYLGEYGDGTEPISAFYQLERTAEIANALDKRDKGVPTLPLNLGEVSPVSSRPRFDPKLAELWVGTLKAQGEVERANEVGLNLSAGYRESGHLLASHRLLQAVDPKSLTTLQLASYEELQPAVAGEIAKDVLASIDVALFEASGIAYEEALSVELSTNEAKARSAASYAALGNYKLALQICDEILSLDPTNLSALTVRYSALVGMGDSDAAAETQRRWLDSVGAQGRSWWPEGAGRDHLIAAGDVGSTVKADEPAVEERAPDSFETELPVDSETTLLRGVSFFELGDVERARAMFKRILALDPAHALAHYYLGLCEFQTGDSVSARDYLRRSLELRPDHPESARARKLLAGGAY